MNVFLLRRGWMLALLGLVLALVLAPASYARMGGGHSFSGSSSHSSSSSGSSSRSSSSSGSYSSGGGFDFHWSTPRSSGYSGSSSSGYSGSSSSDNEGSFTLFVEIVVLIIVIYLLYRLLVGAPTYGKSQTFQSRPATDWARKPDNLDEKLADLKARDGNFSKVLFLDFASLLYHKYYSFRGNTQFKLITPYLAKDILEQTTGNVFYGTQRVHDIVIGSARIANSYTKDATDQLVVEFESNLTIRYPNKEEARFANVEQWTFARQAGVLSPQPEQMRTLSCPACGAPADFTDAGECPYCHSFIQAGEKQWQVLRMKVVSSEPFVAEPGGYAQEAGTELPTLKQADLAFREQALLQKQGLSNWDAFFGQFCEQVAKPYFMATYSAWSEGDWRRARHLVSDRLFESNNFWMEEYARQGWQNRLDKIEIQNVIPARIDLDKFYESITVRIFASCLDYTLDKQGNIIGGSRKKPRKFSEYWTFIRAADAQSKDTVYDLKTCPSCGAPADRIGQAGDCGYCGSKLSEGRFSWVLAIITQDEAYEG
jgi:predicted lipid-binding transport protein (Tim44 family)